MHRTVLTDQDSGGAVGDELHGLRLIVSSNRMHHHLVTGV